MPKLPLLYRYIIKEIASPFLLCLFVFTGVLFLIQSLKLVDLVINKDVPVLDILLLFSYIIPRFLEIAIPMSLLLGTIIAFSRLSTDSELVIIKAAGISIKRLTLPVLIFAALCLLATLLIALWVRPCANYQLGLGMFEIARTRASAGLIPGVFNDMGNITVYAKDINQDTKRLNAVILSDRQDENNPRTFIAKNGHIASDASQRTMSIYLYDGTIQEGFGKNIQFTDFRVNSISIAQSALIEGGPVKDGKKANEMYLNELQSSISLLKNNTHSSKEERQQLKRLIAEFHTRFSIAFSCICVAIIAMALGIQPSRGGKQWGLTANLVLGITTIFFYYMMMALADAMATHATIPIWILIWSPNLLFSIIAVALYRQVGNENWLAVSEAISDLIIKAMYSLRILERSRSEEVAG